MLRSKRTLRDSVGLDQVNQGRGVPAAVAVKLDDEGLVLFGQPPEAHEAMLNLHDFVALAIEGRIECQDLVAMGNLGLGVAAVECFGPEQSGVVQRLPLYIARAGRYALARHVVGDWQIGGRGHGLAFCVPHLGLAREVISRERDTRTAGARC